jgi:hypothetical protein
MIERFSAALVLGLMLTLVGLVTPASADVLVSAPRREVCRWQGFKVGVWYQSYSGGPRGYRISVYGPAGHRVFYRSGTATTTWRSWRLAPLRVGTYRTVYRPAVGASNQWVARYYTRSISCEQG